MKRVKISLASLVLVVVSWAQTPADLVHFIEGKQAKISCANCAEPIAITIHDEPTGGKLIYNSVVDNVPGSSANLGNEHPAFAIVNSNAKHIPIYEPSFEIVQFDYDTKNREMSVYLKNLSDIEFELVRSIDGITFETVANVSDDALFKTTISKSINDYYYQINVISKSKGKRYATKPILVRGSVFVSVYPTVTKDFINIEAQNDLVGCTVSVMDQFGKVQLSYEQLEGKLFTIPLNDLRAGAYFITVKRNNSQEVFKIIHL